MKITVKSTGNLDDITKSIKKLGASSLKVGVFGEDDAEMVQIARVHEYGMVIKPKNGKYLTIPSSPVSKGKRARDFADLFFIPTSNGNGLLARPKGKTGIDVLFVLVKSVTIPERSFLRSGYDENVDSIFRKIESLFPDVLKNQTNHKVFLDAIGEEFVGKVKKKMMSVKSPPKSSVTLAASPNKTNPLIDTGHLRDSITFKVD